MTARNREIAALFHGIADDLVARGQNAYRARAYRRAADSLLSLDEDIAAVSARGGLTDIPGIGKELSLKVQEFLRTGTIAAYEQARKPLPPDVAAWVTLPGLTDTAVHYLYHRLGIRTLPDLQTLVRSHLLRTLPGLSVPEADLLAAIQTRLSSASVHEPPAIRSGATP